MGLLDKLEQVEIKADSRLPEDDLMFCETQQQAYDESCRALREIRQQWKKAIQAQRDLLGIGQDGSLPYFGSNYRFGITDLNRELEKFHSRFISELTQHFNEKYSVTISTDAIKEHLIPAEPDPYRCDMDTSKEYHRNLRALSLHYRQLGRRDRGHRRPPYRGAGRLCGSPAGSVSQPATFHCDRRDDYLCKTQGITANTPRERKRHPAVYAAELAQFSQLRVRQQSHHPGAAL